MHPQPIPWLTQDQDFPPVGQAWDENSSAPGLLAVGGMLNADTLQRAYSKGIFPWFSEGQPTLWWSPNPRMVLIVENFRLHPSLRKTINKFRKTTDCEIRIDSDFEQVIQACATSHRNGQTSTWILPKMIEAYNELYKAGLAHSVETWMNGRLTGGLYCVSLGKCVFGESMFSHSTNASKIALAALVAFCRHHDVRQIDCQQNTRHLTSLGASEISRDLFIEQLTVCNTHEAPTWKFDSLYWHKLMHSKDART